MDNAHAVGLTDNSTQNYSSKMTEADRAAYIWRQWQNVECLIDPDRPAEERKLKASVKIRILENIFTIDPNKNIKAQYRSLNPQIK